MVDLNASINGRLTALSASINTKADSSTAQSGVATQASGDTEAAESPFRLPNSGAAARSEAASTEASEPAHIKQMREHIKELQKQLAEAQKQLQAAMASAGDEQAKAARVLAAQGQVNAISGALMQANNNLLQALLESGGSTSGSSVDTTA